MKERGCSNADLYVLHFFVQNRRKINELRTKSQNFHFFRRRHLVKISEKVMATKIRLFEVINIEEEILSYLDLRSELYEEFPNAMNNDFFF